MRHVSLHDTIDTPSHRPAHTRLLERTPPYNIICLFRACDSFCVAHSFWLPCHISKKSWTLAIRWNFISYTSFFISESFSVFVVSDTGLSPAKIPPLAQANCLTTTSSQRVSPLVFDCLLPITSRPMEKLASTLTPSGMIQNMWCATLERSEYFECNSSWWCH